MFQKPEVKLILCTLNVVVFMTADLVHVNVDFAFSETFFKYSMLKILEGNAQYRSCRTFLY